VTMYTLEMKLCILRKDVPVSFPYPLGRCSIQPLHCLCLPPAGRVSASCACGDAGVCV